MTKLLAKWVLWRAHFCTVHLQPKRYDEGHYYCPDCISVDDRTANERIVRAM